MMRRLAVTVTTAAIGAAAACAELPAGSSAPDFEGTDTHGQTHKLSDHAGKFVVLEWINHGCPFVKKHYNTGNMQALQKEFTGKGVVWFAVCSSAPGKQGDFTAEQWNEMIAEKGSAATAVLLDRDGTIGRAYAAKTTPHMFVINPEGAVIYQGAIDDKADTEESSVPGAQNFVKQALDEAMAGGKVSVAAKPPYGCSVKYQ